MKIGKLAAIVNKCQQLLATTLTRKEKKMKKNSCEEKLTRNLLQVTLNAVNIHNMFNKGNTIENF